ncbi:Type I restriction-modification system, specificity protein [Streptococcus salivarius PS4]|nr:Type I restriction-modification system, specificity protein [Streptococcus salivarius PS4]
MVVKDPNFYFKDGNLIWLRNINFDIIDIDYLYYFLKSDLFQKTIKYNNIGAVQKALTIDFLKTVKITLPSLDNQRKLISVLKSIDKKLKINNKINQELEVMAKTLYDYWFVQFDFPDQNGKPYKSSGGKMVYNPELKREIPDGWGVEKLKDFSQYVSEKVDSSELNIENYVGTDNMIADMGGIELTTSIPKSGTSTKFSVGDILISNIRPYFKKIWLSDRIGGCSADVLCIRTKKIISKEFVYATLARDDFFNYDIAGSKGSKMPRGDKKHIMEYPIVFELGIVEQYSKIVRPIYEAVHENNNQNQELTRLRDWLLPMLMNGQVYKRIEGKND